MKNRLPRKIKKRLRKVGLRIDRYTFNLPKPTLYISDLPKIMLIEPLPYHGVNRITQCDTGRKFIHCNIR